MQYRESKANTFRGRELSEDVLIHSYPKQSSKGMQAGAIPRGVSISHLPTAITVTCDVHRHQHENRKLALMKLESILLAINFNLNEYDLAETPFSK